MIIVVYKLAVTDIMMS